jgi:NPCBM/NEW2 domain
VAVWEDGSESTADEIIDWGRGDGRPNLAGRLLFDARNPVRTICDTKLTRGLAAESYLEFCGGDRLPGRIVQFVPADESSPTPPHFLVEPTIDLGLPNVFRRDRVRVLADWVTAVVQRSGAAARLEPKTLRLIDGKLQAFRAVRWQPEGGQLLTDVGARSFEFAQIASLRTNSGRTWSDWQRQLATLSPSVDSLLVFLDLPGGAHLTTSLERMKPRTQGGDDASRWFFLVQPAWSLDLLAISHQKIRVRTFVPALQTPLSAIDPVRRRRQPVLSSAWTAPRANEGSLGALFRTGGREFAWGIGVTAPEELQFELAESATAVRTRVALDPAAATGGAARARLEFAGATLWKSPVLVGSGPFIDSGRALLRRDLRTTNSTLVLVADAAVRDRPAGTDPFDIRDFVNWLEPVVEHDPARLAREVQSHFAEHRMLAGWTLDPAERGNWRPVNRFDDTRDGDPCFRQILQLDGPLTISRRMETVGDRPTAKFRFGRLGEFAGRTRLEILVNGQPVLTQTMSSSEGSSQPLEIAVPIRGGAAGSSIEFSVRLAPIGRSAVIDWRGITLAR